jgi:2,3-bisphosphoglycerate-dependent phosphoglycerate mutase
MSIPSATYGILVLVRHGESEWNAKNIWTGLTDIGLSEKGKQEAVKVADRIADIRFDAAYTSLLCRASDTLRIILDCLKTPGVTVTACSAFNERDYGIYTGKNKTEVKNQLGDEEYLKLRRGWDYPIQKGESLRQVYDRVTPYYEREIVPLLRDGKHVLIVAHGNSLRALIKKVKNVSDAGIANVELATGEIIMYYFDTSGAVLSEEKRAVAV